MTTSSKSTSSSSTPSPSAQENVFLFVPNLIGYARVVLCIVSLALMPYAPGWAMVVYSISCLLDAVDGHAARYFDQSTKFGAVLDMVTDRSTTACLLVYLATLYPSLTLLFQLLIALDLSSHYLQMYASLTTGADSHKTLSLDSHPFLRLYYTDKRVLFAVCALDQLFYICVYLLGWVDATGRPALEVGSAGRWGVVGVGAVSGVVCVVKQVLNVIQLVGASVTLARVDQSARLKGKKKVR
ncbi:CDP-diacylglycerol-inositol 3-phosphatidyltransferase [Phlyctochytrium bullatum]|nr:CDP-diacylglycerol-inositol 3-phosphatidyltransferase [Phlyctochytrium bullatum]